MIQYHLDSRKNGRFAVPIWKCNPDQVQRDFKRIAKKAGIERPSRAGVHGIRRQVVTTLFNTHGIKDLALWKFLRWSTRESGMLPSYVKIPTAETDKEILTLHPLTEWWKDWVKY